MGRLLKYQLWGFYTPNANALSENIRPTRWNWDAILVEGNWHLQDSIKWNIENIEEKKFQKWDQRDIFDSEKKKVI